MENEALIRMLEQEEKKLAPVEKVEETPTGLLIGLMWAFPAAVAMWFGVWELWVRFQMVVLGR